MNYNWANYSILIADDEPLIIDFFREVLLPTKINMYFAVDGKQTISLVEEHDDINLVLLDIRMPEMNGFEVFKTIKSIRPELPVIAQTAYAFYDDRVKIKAAGFDDYISKPIDNDSLYNKIESFLI
jgi:CheY-like chemotaxis protein